MTLSERFQKLLKKHCSKNPKAVKPGDLEFDLAELPGWTIENKSIKKRFDFKDFHETMKFVNAVADIANQEDHHPDMAVSYNHCTVTYSTHSVGEVTDNDFICAAKVQALSSRQ